VLRDGMENVVMTTVSTDEVDGRLMVAPSVELRWSRAAIVSAFIITLLHADVGMMTLTLRFCVYKTSRI